ncbi:E3 ubiquitin-protein ligase RNF26 [Pithys albifrons albifrons]|uniref:E3 ubiquitin-protein ligase RNF26 n=1 Tax=Pithys albifrons albifrons TaxID=3385563 RepID=UPI003A5D0DBA
MEALLALLRALRLALDLLLLVLDLNFFLVSSLVSALRWVLCAACGLPAACGDALVRAGRGAAALALRGRELAQRGVCAALGGGQALCRQAGEALGIAGSLLLYLANSLLNVCLLGAQDLLTLLAALGDALAAPLLRAAELLAACLAHVSSAAIALSILLWSPCQLAFELLCAAAELFVSVFFVNVYGLGLLLLLVAAGALLLNPALLGTLLAHLLAHLRALPAPRRLQRDAWRLYQVAVLSLGMAVAAQPWRRLAEWALQVMDWSLQVTNWSRGGRGMNQGSAQRGAVAVPRALAPRRVVLGPVLGYGEELVAPPRAGTAHGRVTLGRVLDDDEELLEAAQVAPPRAGTAHGRRTLGQVLDDDEELVAPPRAGTAHGRRTLGQVLDDDEELVAPPRAGTAHGRRTLGQVLDDDEELVAPPRAGTAHGRVTLGRVLDDDDELPEVAEVPLPRPALSRGAAGQRPQAPREEPGTAWGNPRNQQRNAGSAEGAADGDPWALLKEQEERKKCVICQDQTKTVLLLPCRHLCLCQECTEVLLQQAIYQRNCPLCRQMILQTLNVYL